MNKLNKKGFSIIEIVLVVFVIGLVVGLGLYAKNRINDKSSRADSATATPGILCQGSGTDGLRHQAVYAKLQGQPDNYNQTVAKIKIGAATAERGIRESAVVNGGGVRHVRWVTDANCNLSVLNITLPNSETYARPEYLRAAGLTDPNRKYVVWVDTTNGFNGVTIWNDAAESDRLTWSIINKSGWETIQTVAHEIMHGLGGRAGSPDSYKSVVGKQSPHSSGINGTGHCYDWGDMMCYYDAAGMPAPEFNCPDVRSYTLFDCRGDDYYSTAPASNSWLALHPERNGALSPFLATSGTVGQPNDFFWDKRVLPATAQTVTGSNTNATAEFSEAAHAGNTAKRSIWYQWTPTTSGPVTIKTYTNTSISSFDTVVAVYTGADEPILQRNTLGTYIKGIAPSIATLSPIASNDNYDGRTGSRVRFNAVAGTKYKIAIDGKNGATGRTVLSIIRQ